MIDVSVGLIVVIASQVCTYVEIHKFTYYKYLVFGVCQFYLNKAIF